MEDRKPVDPDFFRVVLVGGQAVALCGQAARVRFEVRFMVWLKTALVLRLLW